MKNRDMPAMATHEQADGHYADPKRCTHFVPHHGLTKREHFAGLAMQGFASHPDIYRGDVDHVASASVEWADALLAELENNQ